VRSMPRDFSAMWNCAATATRCWSSSSNVPRSPSSSSRATRDIKTEDLQKSLRNVGLATGKTFDRSVLDEVKQYLTDQYFSRGKYAVRVDNQDHGSAGNKVDVIVDIKEGKAREDRTDQPGRQHQVQGKGHPRQLRIEDPELAVLVQAGRPIFARVPDRGPGKAPFLLHGSRLRELSDRVDAGGHSA